MSTADPLIGKTMGDYVIESLLGRGGMARVYRGYDENLDRYAAVKVIEAHLLAGDDRDEYYQRFQREARAIARLRHPNIVGVYQFGKAEDDYYMAMVFIEGEDLRQILKRHHQQGTIMSLTMALKIMRAMTSALDYAHEHEVIHRDVKPSNILVTKDGNAVLTDFGLALNVPEGTIGNTFGSAHYIAPEQAVSSAQAVAQSDLYSLGICLYEMLTGRVPFDDNSAMSVALKHLSDPPPPPSELNPKIPDQIEEVIMRVLNKEPEDRYESGAVFMQALDEAITASNIRETRELAPEPKLLAQDDNRASSAPIFQSSVPSPLSTTEAQQVKQAPSQNDLIRQTSARLQQVEPQNRNRMVFIIGGIIVLIVLLLGAVGAAYVINNPPTTPTDVAAVVPVQTEAVTDTVTASVTPEPTTEEAVVLPAATEEATATPTEDATNTPTDAPTVEATDTPTSEPTDTPTEAATAELTEEVVNQPVVEARYDNRSFVLYNASGETVDVSGLVFVQEIANGSRLTFRSNEWRRQASRPPERLPDQDCYQVWTTRFTLLPHPTYCDSRHAWRSVAPNEAFWIANGDAESFTVEEGGNVIATCDFAAERCEIPAKPR